MYAEKLGYPVVLKIISPDILRKTGVGGVLVGLSSIETVEAGHRQIIENARPRRPDAKISGMLIHEMARESTEIIVAH